MTEQTIHRAFHFENFLRHRRVHVRVSHKLAEQSERNLRHKTLETAGENSCTMRLIGSGSPFANRPKSKSHQSRNNENQRPVRGKLCRIHKMGLIEIEFLDVITSVADRLFTHINSKASYQFTGFSNTPNTALLMFKPSP
jgi:hypothetical protein